MITLLFMTLTACNESKPSGDEDGLLFSIGDQVPKDEVCMVNNAYMGKRQIEVSYHGKKYYGCCEMCEKRIPREQEIRIAIDPVSGKQVDKADAVIAISGKNNEISYFENKENYKAYFANRK